MTVEQYESAPDTLDIRELEVGGKTLVTTATPQTLSATDKNKGFGKGASDEIWTSEKA